MTTEKEKRILLADNNPEMREATIRVLKSGCPGNLVFEETGTYQETLDRVTDQGMAPRVDLYIIDGFCGGGKSLVATLDSQGRRAVMYTANAILVQEAMDERVPVIAKGRVNILTGWVNQKFGDSY